MRGQVLSYSIVILCSPLPPNLFIQFFISLLHQCPKYGFVLYDISSLAVMRKSHTKKPQHRMLRNEDVMRSGFGPKGRKENYLPDVLRVGQEHRETINADADAAIRRHTILHCFKV